MRAASVKPANLPTQSDVVAPTSTTKRQAILNAAALEFLEKGYGAASMDDIAAKAGVSKQTVYSHFGAKSSLFEGIVRERCEALTGAGSLIEVSGAPDEVLTGLARKFLSTVLDRSNLALYRVIVAESGRFPELAEAFYRAGPDAAANGLAAYIDRERQIGTLRVGNPRRAAEDFFALMRGDLFMRHLLGLADEPPPSVVEAAAGHAVYVFLGKYGAY